MGSDEAAPQLGQLLVDTLKLGVDLREEMLMLGLELDDGGDQLLGGSVMQLVLGDEGGCGCGHGGRGRGRR